MHFLGTKNLFHPKTPEHWNMLNKWRSELPHIEKLLADGMKVPGVASYYGVSRQHINRVLRALDSPLKAKRKRKPRPPKLTRAQAANPRMRDLLEANQMKAAKHILFTTTKHRVEATGQAWEIEPRHVMWNTFCPIRKIEIEYRLHYTHAHKHTQPVIALRNYQRGYVPGNVWVVSAMGARMPRSPRVPRVSRD